MKPPFSVRVAAALYTVGTWTLPRSFRSGYGIEMRQDLEGLLVRTWQQQGVMHVALQWGRAMLDLVARFAIERSGQISRLLDPAASGHQGGMDSDTHNRSGIRPGRGQNWRERMMGAVRGMRLATRALSKMPGFTTTAILTLGLGLGSVVAIFTLVNAILLEPLPVPDSDRIVFVEHHAPGLDLPNLSNSPGTLALYWDDADFFSALAGVDIGERVLTGFDLPSRIPVLHATPQFFEVMGVQPATGRPLGEADNAAGAAAVAIATHGFWTSQLGSDPNVLGRTLLLDGVSTEIVGVMPPDFHFPGNTQPLAIAPYGPVDPQDFGSFGLRALARLAPGISLEQAQGGITALQARIPERFPDTDASFLESAGWSASVIRFKDVVVGDLATTLWLVLGTVGFVLLIACANVANLFLVRAEGRQKEIAVRAAMGAARKQIAGSFLSEGLVLGLVGGVVGVVASQLGVAALLRFGPDNIPRAGEVALTPTVLVFAAVLAIVAGAVLGTVPMIRYTPRAFADILRDGGRGATKGRARRRGQNLLVMTQLALALVLVIGSGLMLRSFAALREVDLGFEEEGVLAMEVSLGDGMAIAEAAQFYQALMDEIRHLPGVQAVGVITQPPLSSGSANGGSFSIRGQPREEDALPPVAFYRAISPGYFQTMGIPVLEGRDVAHADMDGTAPMVWVDERFAETHFPGGAVGEFITWEETEEPADPEQVPWAQIVGVVGNVRHLSLRDDPRLGAYFPLVAGSMGYPSIATASLVLKTSGGTAATSTVSRVREAVARVNSQVPVTQVRTMEDVVGRALSGDSVTMVLIGIAAAMALFLGSIGLFGIISYVVGQRRREIGVRMALGAQQSGVSHMVLRQGLTVAGAGILVGLGGALGLTRLMEAILYDVSATDPVTFALAATLLLAVSALATWLPAQRAARVDPVESLRGD